MDTEGCFFLKRSTSKRLTCVCLLGFHDDLSHIPEGGGPHARIHLRQFTQTDGQVHSPVEADKVRFVYA